MPETVTMYAAVIIPLVIIAVPIFIALGVELYASYKSWKDK